RPGVTEGKAAGALGCAVRTIWRDVNALEKAGMPLYPERAADGYKSVWRVRAEFKRSLPLKMTLGELAALVMSRELMAPLGASVLGPAATAAFDKIQAVLSRGGLYLVGWCHLRQALRIFAVERMRDVALLRRTFTVRPGFDADEYLGKSWGIVQGELVTVKVVFAKSLARYIRERLWHPSQKLRDLPDGRLEMMLQVADTLEVRRWILGYGVQAEVLAPEGLREALRAEAVDLALRLGPQRRPLGPTRTATSVRATSSHPNRAS